MAKRIDSLTPDTEVTLRFHHRGNSYDEAATFLGISGEGDDRRARFRSADTETLTAGRTYEWEAYRYNGHWAYGTSADRLSLV